MPRTSSSKSSHSASASTSTRRTRRRKVQIPDLPTWKAGAELVGLEFELKPNAADLLPVNYTTGLHAWLLQQIRAVNPALSAYLHDGESEKAFTISKLQGDFQSEGRQLRLQPDQTYRWTVTALSRTTVQGMAAWLPSLANRIELHSTTLTIQTINLALPAATYEEYRQLTVPRSPSVTLSFLSPTSFRRKGHHLPLPWPRNVFQSYLRRWNDFAGEPLEADPFLEWIDQSVIIQRHQLKSEKTAAGKRGSVTGFVGSIQYGLSSKAQAQRQFVERFYQLGQLAPYFGTGHKTPFGLGQTRLGWMAEAETPSANPVETLLAQRITELTDLFLSQRKRTGGSRAQNVAESQATILARRELGESLQDIAASMDIPYETAKTYSKLARRSLREGSIRRR